MPVYSLNGTDHLLGIQVFKKHFNLNFLQGAQLYDPQGSLAGNGKQVRNVSFRTINDIGESVLRALIDQTIAKARGI